MQAIQTRYKGYHFRSRLEARWAVFFDTLLIPWKYECEGFIDPISEFAYCPDFYLPKTQTWVEVKGDITSVPESWFNNFVTSNDYGKGLPGMGDSQDDSDLVRGLLWLSDIPNPWAARDKLFPIFQHHEGVHINLVCFTEVGPTVVGEYRANVQGESGIGSMIDEVCNNEWGESFAPDEVRSAYTAARSARFDHGWSGES